MDNNDNNSLDQVSQETTSSEATSQAEGTLEGLSKEAQLIAEHVLTAVRGELNEFAKRQQQSVKDTVSSRVKKEMERLQAAGINVSTEQAEKLVSSQEKEDVPEPASVAPAQSPAPEIASEAARKPAVETVPVDPIVKQATDWLIQDGINPNDADPIVKEVYLMQAKAGVHLVDDDPEVADLNEKVKGKSLYEIMRIVDETIQTKKKRISREGSPARIPALSQGTTARPDLTRTPSTSIFDDYYKRR